MEYIKSFDKGLDVLDANDIVDAVSFEEVVKEDYTKSYVFGLLIRELMSQKTLRRELIQDLTSMKKIPKEFEEATKETLEVLEEYRSIMGEDIDPLPVVNYILTVLDKHGYSKEIMILISFFLGQAAKCSAVV